MRGVNKVIVCGNLGRDPEIQYTGNGTAIATLAIATSEQWTDKQSGEKQEKTSWHRVKLFGRLAEVAGEYLQKGRQVYIEGKLSYGSYEKDGVTHYTTDIIGGEMQMLGGGSGDGGGNGGQRQGGNGGSGGGQRQGNGGQRSQDRHTNLDQRGGGNNGGSYGGGRGGDNYGYGNGHGSRGPAQKNSFDDDDSIPF